MVNLGSTLLLEPPVLHEVEPQREPDEPSLSTAEVAECTCPDFCERDHDLD